jgi:flagellar biosynthesis/type III secretory pathway protein FliH
MSAVIKSGDASARVRPLTLVNAVLRPTKEDEERDQFRRKIAALEGEIRNREILIAGLRAEAEAAFARGKTEGRDEGVASAGKREAERLALLDGAARESREQFETALLSLDRLSTVLARDVLEIVFGDAEYRGDLVEKIMKAEMAKIEASAVVEISVSAADFPDKKAALSAANRAGVASRVSVVVADAPSGSCAITLRLGRLEVGIDQQWGVLRERLTELSRPERDL